MQDISSGMTLPSARVLIQEYRIPYTKARDILETLVERGTLQKRSNRYHVVESNIDKE